MNCKAQYVTDPEHFRCRWIRREVIIPDMELARNPRITPHDVQEQLGQELIDFSSEYALEERREWTRDGWIYRQCVFSLN